VNQILSQDEVDALLKGLDTGEVEAEEEPVEPQEDLEVYDWAAQGRNLKADMPILGLMNGRLATKLHTALSGILRKRVEVEAGPLEAIKFEEFQRSLPIPTSLHLFKMEPLRGTGMLVIESRLVFNLIEAFFGGASMGNTKVEGRDFTPIERRIIEKVVHMVLQGMEEAWREVFPIHPQFIRSESNPLGVNVVPPAELLVSVKFELELNNTGGNIILCIPQSSLEPIRDKLAGGYHQEDQDQDEGWVHLFGERLKEAEVELSVDLGKTRIPLGHYLNMQVGDILVLDNHFESRLTARVEGLPKLEGYVGRFKNRRVFRVEGEIVS